MGILCFVKVHSRLESGDVRSSRRITDFNFPSDIFSAAFCSAGLVGVREVFSKQLRTLTHGASHAVVQSVGSVARHLEGMNHTSGASAFLPEEEFYNCSCFPARVFLHKQSICDVFGNEGDFFFFFWLFLFPQTG